MFWGWTGLASFVMSGFVVLASSQALAACNINWPNFIATADVAAYSAVASEIAECRRKHTLAEVMPDDRTLVLLIQLVEAKNPQAIRLVLSISDILNGGNLEDAARALGQLADSDPAMFLRLTAGPQQRFLLTRALPMMPESAIDDPEIRQLRIRERMARIAAVNDPALAEAKRKALAILEPR